MKKRKVKPKKVSSYQKLKDKIALIEKEKAELRSDFKKVLIDKDFMVTTTWSHIFTSEAEIERQIWAGNVSKTKKRFFGGMLT